MNETKPHISPSQMGMFWRCGEQYRRRYIEGEKIPPGIALIIGSSVHKCVEADMRAKLETKELLKDDEIKDKARDIVTVELAGEVFLNEEEKADEKVAKGEAIDTTISLASCHHKDVAPNIEPNQIERPVRLVLARYPFDVEARLDLRDTSGIIHDTKTAGKSPSQQEADTNTGLTVYHWCSEIIGAPHSDTVVLDALVKSKKSKAVTVQSTRSKDDHLTLLRRAVNMWQALEKQIFVPCAPGDWQCSPQFCGYFSTCIYANQTHRPKT